MPEADDSGAVSVWESIKDAVRERIGSPILGSFSIAWAITNYRFILILATSLPVDERIRLAQSTQFPTTEDIWVRGVAIPAIATALYLFVYPFPTLLVLKFRYWMRLQEHAARIKSDGSAVLTLEDSQRLLIKISEMEGAHRAELATRQQTIEALGAELSRAQLALREASKGRSAEPADAIQFKDSQEEAGVRAILRVLSQRNGEEEDQALMSGIGENYVTTQRYVNAGLRVGVLVRKQVRNLPGVALSELGRNLVVASSTNS